MTPAVSVLMPVLNPHPVYFPEAVKSILAQTLSNWELVIVEDPSPSSAAELLKPLADPRIRLISNPARTGLIAQLNQGLGECRSDLVARMDADDIAEPTRLAEQLACLTANPDIDLVGTQLAIIDHEGKQLGFRQYPTSHEDIVRTLHSSNCIAHPSTMFRRHAVLQLGGYQLDGPAEDYDLWSRMALSGYRLANLPNCLLRYRLHPGGSKAEKLRAMLRWTLDVKRRYWWGSMRVKDRLRYRAEQFLLRLPAKWVYSLFFSVTCRGRLRVPAAP